MPDWRLAKSLETLRAQINAEWPNRDKTADGTIGDTRHQASVSDHNPNTAGVVTAFDCTHDPEGGPDMGKVLFAIVKSRDKRLKYAIFKGRIIAGNDGPEPWVYREYNGSNPHDHHCHISVETNSVLYDNAERWQIELPKPPVVKKVRYEFWDEGKKIAQSIEVKAGDATELPRLQTFLDRIDQGVMNQLQNEGDVAEVKLVRRVTQK